MHSPAGRDACTAAQTQSRCSRWTTRVESDDATQLAGCFWIKVTETAERACCPVAPCVQISACRRSGAGDLLRRCGGRESDRTTVTHNEPLDKMISKMWFGGELTSLETILDTSVSKTSSSSGDEVKGKKWIILVGVWWRFWHGRDTDGSWQHLSPRP